MRTSIRAALAVAALALVVSGCGSDGSDSGSATQPLTADDLDGSTYTSTSSTGKDLVEGTVVTLVFEDGRLAVSAGCNTQTGDFQVEDDTLKWTGPAAATMMACSPELMDQDAWLGALFSDGAGASLDGDTLTLTGDDVTLELSDAS